MRADGFIVPSSELPNRVDSCRYMGFQPPIRMQNSTESGMGIS